MLVFLTYVFILASVSADVVYGNYRPPLPILDQIFGGIHVGDPPIYDYAKSYRDAMNSMQFGDGVLNQGLVFTDAVQRRIDTGSNNQYANQWGSGQNSWVYPNRRNVANNNGKQTNQANHGNIQGTQLDDVTRTGINEQVTNRRKQDYSKETDTQGTRNTKPKLFNEYIPTTRNKDATSHTGATSDYDSKNGQVPEEYKKTANTNVNVKFGTKTTQDNEVTPKPEDKKKAGPAGDRWVWSSEEVETTTIMGLKDRAAFEVITCPTPKVKVGNRCVLPD